MNNLPEVRSIIFERDRFQNGFAPVRSSTITINTPMGLMIMSIKSYESYECDGIIKHFTNLINNKGLVNVASPTFIMLLLMSLCNGERVAIQVRMLHVAHKDAVISC